MHTVDLLSVNDSMYLVQDDRQCTCALCTIVEIKICLSYRNIFECILYLWGYATPMMTWTCSTVLYCRRDLFFHGSIIQLIYLIYQL